MGSWGIKVTPETRRVQIQIPNHTKIHNDGIRFALFETGQEVVDEIRRLIKDPPKTGRIYNFRGRPHQASAPGEAPANRSGKLMKSSFFIVRGFRQMEVGENVGDVPYDEFLESGTKKMKPRQHVIKAVNSTTRNLVKAFETHVQRELNL